MKETAKKTLVLVGILTAVLFSYFINIAYLPLWDPDEPYYIESGREMINRGDIVTPYFNYEPRLNKPIFFYWLQILTGKIFGFNEFSARFPSFIAGLALLWLIYRLGALLYDKRTGLIAALIGATSFEIYVLSRQAVTDMCLAFFMTLAIYGYVSAWMSKNTGNKWYLFYIGTAFAVITKGPVGLLLPSMVITIIMIVQRNFSIIKKMHILKGIAIFLAIASPWYIAVLIQHGFNFFKEFIIENNLLRYITPMYKHTGGIFYYVPVLLLGFFPWILFLVISIKEQLVQVKTHKININGKKNSASFAFLLNIIWFAVYFLFFSFSGSKLPSYILGIFPALSLFTASGLMIKTGKKSKFSSMMKSFHHVYFWMIIVALMLILRYSFFQGWGLIASVLAALLIVTITLNIFDLSFFKEILPKDNSRIFQATLAATLLLLISANLVLFPAMADYFPIKKLGQLTAKINVQKDDVLAYRYYEPSMVFYSENKVLYIEKMEELNKYLKKNTPFYAFMTLRHFKELPSEMKNEFSILSYGIRYRNRIRDISSLFATTTGQKNYPRGLLMVYRLTQVRK